MSGHYDIIVIGTGSMGAAACYNAAGQGLKVLGLDQFDPPHSLGSHSGLTRIIRQAYFEHPDYVPLLQKAYENWTELEAESGQQLFNKSGLLYVGKKEGPIMKGVRASAEAFDLKIEELGKKERAERFPEMYFPDELDAIFEGNAGFLMADQAIGAMLTMAKEKGAELRSNQKVISWELRNSHVVVFTEKESFHAGKIIVTSGAYAKKLLPRLRSKLKVTRQSQYWFKPKDPELFKAPKFTCWNVKDPDYPGLFYGFPYVDEKENPDNYGLKVAYHYPGLSTNPSDDNLSRDKPPDEKEISEIRNVLSKYLPKALGPLLRHKNCFYTYSPDENFIIDHLPNTNSRVIFGAGFSGHGFKFAPLVGEVLVDMAVKGQSDLELEFLKLSLR